MLTIQHAEPGASSTKAYADACWRNNPAIPADYWRELLGETTGKLALDWRAAVGAEDLLAKGVNLVLTTPETQAAAHARLAQALPAGAGLTVCFTATPETLPDPAPAYLVWQAEQTPTPEQANAALAALEGFAKADAIAAYGIADPGQSETQPAVPLHQWLAWAEAAAQAVHGRRKRPALQLLAVEMDLLNLTPLTHPTAQHKKEQVSALEFAARLGWAVIALPQALPTGAAPPPEAVEAFTRTAQHEHQLNQQLGGWPMVEGKPLFNVLQHLGQGATPWPTPHHWQAWRRHVWPQIHAHWQQIQSGLPDALCQAVVNYCRQLESLHRHGHALANATAYHPQEKILAELVPHFPVEWRMARPAAQVAGLLAAIPGITAVALAPAHAPAVLAELQTRKDFPDLGAILAA